MTLKKYINSILILLVEGMWCDISILVSHLSLYQDNGGCSREHMEGDLCSLEAAGARILIEHLDFSNALSEASDK